MTLPLLLEADQLEAALADETLRQQLLIIDTSSADNYAKHHVPGAIHLPPASLQRGEKPAPGKLPHPEQLQAMFSSLGLSPEKHVVVYDDEGGGWAGRLIWTLDVLGHRNYSYLDGGLHAWVNEGHPCEQTANSGDVVDFQVSIDSSVIAEVEDILPRLGAADFAVWDARSAEEHSGSKILAARGGRIPGAFNIDWLDLMDRERNMRLIDLDGLRQTLANLGVSTDTQVVTHCQTHHRSGLSYLAMKLLGFTNIQGYHGSWSEWGNREDTPIEGETRAA